MRSLHQVLINSEFSDRYLTLKQRLPKLKHLIHGGIENYYAGLDVEHLKSSGIEDRLCSESINRTLTNIEIGLDNVMGLDLIQNELYIHCHPRPTEGEKAREAIWQFSIYAEYRVVAVVGMNFHKEQEIVGTIANIQGYDSQGINSLKEICGKTPWTIESIGLILKNLPEEISIIRGISSCLHPFKGSQGFDKHRASNLYDRSFKALGMTPIRNKQGKVKYYELVR